MSSTLNLVRPMEVGILLLFPAAGFQLNHAGFPPLQLLLTALFFSIALVVDNALEGYLHHPDDAAGGDYPVSFFEEREDAVKNLRALLYAAYLLTALLQSLSLLFLALFPYIFARIYNDHRVMAKSRPPLGLLSHFSGAVLFYCLGALWYPAETLTLLCGFGMAGIYSGGYLNHLHIDRERDERLGVRTLAHRVRPDLLSSSGAAFIMAGDLVIAYCFRENLHVLLVFFGLAVLTGISRSLFLNPRIFRTVYRFFHGTALITLLLLYFLL